MEILTDLQFIGAVSRYTSDARDANAKGNRMPNAPTIGEGFWRAGILTP